jgi:hypothetical protein
MQGVESHGALPSARTIRAAGSTPMTDLTRCGYRALPAGPSL